MIFDQIQNAAKFKTLSKNLDIAFSYLMETNLEALTPGKHFILDDKIYASVSEYNTKEKNEIDWEAHKKYIDIQSLLSGEEIIGHAQLNDMKLIKEYDEGRDIAFFHGSGNNITLKPGLFAVFFPYDAHKPGLIYLKSGLVKKLVIKVLSE